MWTDINECVQGNSCDSTSTTCRNTVGSYVCDCKTGFKQLSDLICQGEKLPSVYIFFFILFFPINKMQPVVLQAI